MDILFYHPFLKSELWLPKLKASLPQANIRVWKEGDNEPADYALVWKPPKDMLASRKGLKAIFILGAGVDALLAQLKETPDLFPKNIPLYRLQDTGMVAQMQEYTCAAVLHYFRRFDDYLVLQQNREWRQLPPYEYQDFTIGVMGLGILGAEVAKRLALLGFPVKGWSRSAKSIPNIQTYSEPQLTDFLTGTRVLINLLPSTPQTKGILNYSLFEKLAPDAYIINIARGAHLVEEDLIKALDNKIIKAATLDVFLQEPLPNIHPLWNRSEVIVTPHISAITKPAIAAEQIVEKILLLENGVAVVDGIVDIEKGY